MSTRDVWQELYQRFDPYGGTIPPAWRAERQRSPARSMAELLGAPFGETRILLLGTVGTGKTTELGRIAEARAPHDFVLTLDLVQHFEHVVGNLPALQHIGAWEVAFLAALALYRAAAERISFAWPADVREGLEDAWSTAAQATGTTDAKTKIDLGKLMLSMAGVGAALVPGGPMLSAGAAAVADAVETRWSLPLGRSQRRLPDDHEPMRTLLARVNRVIGELQLRHRRVLLIIDGLDRIHDVERARDIFVESDILGRLACPVILSAPFALRHHPAVSQVRRFQIYPLVNEPVLDQERPDRPGPGIDFFLDLFMCRTRDLSGAAALVPEPLVRKLALYSGGRARDFIKLMRLVAMKAWLADAPAATEAIIDEAIDEERRLLETGLDRGHIDVLAGVMGDPDHRLPRDELVWQLLESSRLLPYPDHSEWFYPHPLLTMYLVKPRPGSATSPPPST